VIKTRVQTWDLLPAPRATVLGNTEAEPLLGRAHSSASKSVISERPSTYDIARMTYKAEGISVFFRGLGICSARAFFVNAVQWAVSAITQLLTCSTTDKTKGIRMDDESASLMLLPIPLSPIRHAVRAGNHQLVKHVHVHISLSVEAINHSACPEVAAFRNVTWTSLAFCSQ
jgi:hypothetical protein